MNAVPSRDAAGQPLTLNSYTVRFADLADVDRTTPAEAPNVLADVLNRATKRTTKRLTLAEELATQWDSTEERRVGKEC